MRDTHRNGDTKINRLNPTLMPGIDIACCHVSPECEKQLTIDEHASLAGCVPSVRRQAAAARMAARTLLDEAGHPDWSLPRRQGNPPTWPRGLVGSLSHCRNLAVAALTTRRTWLGIGIDVEPAEPLEEELLDTIASPEELSETGHDPMAVRILFSLKEAVYKAVHPMDQRFLEPHEVRVHLGEKRALTNYGREVPVRYIVNGHIVALAAVPASG